METEVENQSDQQNLVSSQVHENLIHEELQSEIQQSSGSNSNNCPLALQNESLPIWKLPLLSALLVLCTSGLVITLPPYLESVNLSGDAYSAVLFVSLFTCLPIVLYNQVKSSYFCQFHRLGPSSPLRIVKYGIWHGVSFLVMAYSLDRKRVLCHIQEPMMGLVVMYMIVIYFVYKGPELNSLKMLCLCGVLAGLFLSMDFQLNDIYKCHGATRFSPADDGGPWMPKTHTLWMITFAAFLLLFTLSWLWLERDILCRKNSVTSLRVINTISSDMPSQNATDTEALLDVNYEGSSSAGGETNTFPLIPPLPSALFNKWLNSLVWFLMASSLTIISLIWTDCFEVLGKGNSWSAFANLTTNGLGCHFHYNENCGPTALYGWLFVAFHLGFLISLGQVFAISNSMIFSLSLASLSLPFSSLWWSLFTIGGKFAMTWNPQVSGELIFSLLGFPLMLLCLMYWCHLDRLKRAQTNNFLMSSTCSINHV